MLAGRVILVMVAVRFPRPKVLEDFIDLVVRRSFALSGAALQKLGEIVNVLSGTVSERSQAIQVPAEVNEFRAAPGEAQDVGGCEGVYAVEQAVSERLRSLSSSLGGLLVLVSYRPLATTTKETPSKKTQQLP